MKRQRIKKALLFYPPVGLYQRGEERCQAHIKGSPTLSMRACNDLGYLASVLQNMDIIPLIRDYPSEKNNWEDYKKDLAEFMPDLIIMSITTATIAADMLAFKLASAITPETWTIAKGAYFFSCDLNNLQPEIYQYMDIALTQEAETIIAKLIKAIHASTPLNLVKGLICKDNDSKTFHKTEPAPFLKNLDSLAFPARDLMNNKLYIRPDTKEPQATIQTSRGCPFGCIYCLTPLISGKQIRRRSPQNIAEEVEECVNKYQILNFFFRADTFTLEKKWVIEICQEILQRKLAINWVANSRVKPLDEEMLHWMKKAGCWLLALGIESGNEESLQKMEKGTTLEDIRQAVKLARCLGLKTYGFFMFGFFWEDHRHIKDTINFAVELNCDFSEVHLATPYEGTELYKMTKKHNLLSGKPTGYNYFDSPLTGTLFVPKEELIKYRQQALKAIYLRPKYIIRSLFKIRSYPELTSYLKHGFRLLKQLYG